jgi:hypothetical protein
VLGLVIAAVAITGKIAPWGSSVLYDLGIGPIMLQGLLGPQDVASVPHAPRWIWFLWTVAAAWGAAVLLLRAGGEVARWPRDSVRDDRVRRARIVFAVSALAIFATPMILVGFYDRYLLSTLPVTFALCVLLARGRPSPAPARWAAGALLGVYVAFGVGAAHDFFAVNRARWTAIRSMLAAGYQVDQVNGGVEYAGWHGMHSTGAPLHMPNAVVVVTLDPLPDHVVCGAVPFRRWLPPRQESVWILGRDASACHRGS